MAESTFHNAMKYGLAYKIEEEVESKSKLSDIDLFVEKGVDCDQVNNLADVRVDIPHNGYQGFLFEIKSRCNRRERIRSFDQLASYLQAGYHPVLVAPSDFYDSGGMELVPKDHRVQYQRLMTSLKTDIIDVTTEHGIQFSPVSSYRYDTVADLLFNHLNED